MAEAHYEFTYQGRIIEIGQVMTFNSGFKKRTIVIDKAPVGADYPNPVPFTLSKDDVKKADTLKVGMTVKVNGYIDGRAWVNPKDNQTKYFADLRVFGKIEIISNGESNDTFAEAEKGTEDNPSADYDDVADDMPF